MHPDIRWSYNRSDNFLAVNLYSPLSGFILSVRQHLDLCCGWRDIPPSALPPAVDETVSVAEGGLSLFDMSCMAEQRSSHYWHHWWQIDIVRVRRVKKRIYVRQFAAEWTSWDRISHQLRWIVSELLNHVICDTVVTDLYSCYLCCVGVECYVTLVQHSVMTPNVWR